MILTFCGIFCSGCTLLSEAGDFFRRNNPPPSDPPYARTGLNGKTVEEEDGKEIDRMVNQFSMALIMKGMAKTAVSGVKPARTVPKGSPAVRLGETAFTKLTASRLLCYDPSSETVLCSSLGNHVWQLSLQRKGTVLLSVSIPVSGEWKQAR